jgi:hypothetical protein
MSETRYTANPLEFTIPQIDPNWTGKRGRSLLLGSGDRINIYSPTRAIEAHIAIDQRKNGVVATEPDVPPWQKFRPALADDNVSGHDQFAAESFHTQPLADAVAAVLNAALSFFMCHLKKLLVES